MSQLKPKKAVLNREKLRFQFSGKNRSFGVGSVLVTALKIMMNRRRERKLKSVVNAVHAKGC